MPSLQTEMGSVPHQGNTQTIGGIRKRPNSPEDDAFKEYFEGNFTRFDVLLGRGGLANRHLGNQDYLREKERYLAASKDEKTGISQELVD